MHALEAAAFAAWPALSETLYRGWHLRWAEGYTKRANSANAGPQAQALGEADIDSVAGFYQARQLPAIFRLTSATSPAGVDALLGRLGYQHRDASLVLHGALDSASAAGPQLYDARHWLQGFQQIAGQLGPDQQRHLQLIDAIAAPCAFALDLHDGEPVCCGLAVQVGDQLGLFDVATAPAYRGQGRAARLCRQLLAWGRQRGAQRAFLQVLASNQPAIRLYEGLGLRPAYHYWYRVKAA